MVLKPEPLFEAVESLTCAEPAVTARTAIALLSASGKLFRQDTARRFAQLDRIILLCGRYEGVDERVAEHLATDELSIGDFVLSGGELAAALVMDAVTRLIPGALGNEDSSVNESFSATEALGIPASPITNRESRITSHGILDFPHYTRPAEFRGWQVPEILIGGNHEEIRRWRQEKALEKTRRNRPDLLAAAPPNTA
jgi:tRNA (guanine37-N1)-methyltransferase